MFALAAHVQSLSKTEDAWDIHATTIPNFHAPVYHFCAVEYSDVNGYLWIFTARNTNIKIIDPADLSVDSIAMADTYTTPG